MAGELLTLDGQLQWRGVLLGSGSPYGLTGLSGWIDLPDMRGDDKPRPGRHGMFQGRSLAGKRIVVFNFTIKPGVGGVSFQQAVDTLRTITAPTESPTEEPLAIRLGGQGWWASARAKKRSLTVDTLHSVGYATGSILWEATDPRVYGLAQQTQATGLASPPTDGLVFPITAPLVFGTGRAGGQMVVTNTGGASSWPLFQIKGPITAPVITNLDTGQVLAFSSSLVLASTDTLTIDTDSRAVTLAGVSRNNTLAVRQWFPVLPGSTRIGFTASTYNAAALLTASWYHASM